MYIPEGRARGLGDARSGYSALLLPVESEAQDVHRGAKTGREVGGWGEVELMLAKAGVGARWTWHSQAVWHRFLLVELKLEAEHVREVARVEEAD